MRFVSLACLAWLLCVSAYAVSQEVFDGGITSYGQKKYREALEKFTKATKADPRNSSGYLYQANCRYMLGDVAGAIKLYQYIVKYFPQSAAGRQAAQFLATRGSGASHNETTRKASSTATNESGDDREDNPVPDSMASLVKVVRPRADRPAVSTSVLATIKAALDRLPKSIKSTLWKNDIKIFVTPTVEDYEPGVKYQEARGYEGGTYKSCPAFYSNGKVVLAEHTLDESDESVNAAFSPEHMVNSLYHETGHALDDCLQDISTCEEFKHAYLLDSARIEPATAHRLRYYLQKSTAGQGECCAELIGSLLGQRESHTNEMMASFPLTLKFLRAKLQI